MKFKIDDFSHIYPILEKWWEKHYSTPTDQKIQEYAVLSGFHLIATWHFISILDNNHSSALKHRDRLLNFYGYEGIK